MTTPKDIITYMEQNPSMLTDWAHEFFAGKYTPEETHMYMWEKGENSNVRKGVLKLAEEFNNLETKDVDGIRQWYADTDFYIYDLLPFNGGPMFREKADVILKLITDSNFKTVTDFGGGLGILSLYIALNTDCVVYYVDLPNSVTGRFAKFLIEKLGVKNIHLLTDEEYFASDITTDCIIATDCFEHIPNMEETFDKLIEHSYVIYHDSTFFTDQYQPQHVYTPKYVDFLNMCALRNYLPKQDPRLLVRSYLQFNESGQMNVHFVR